MTLTTHALVGTAAASLFPQHPYLAFAAGFASHFVIDALPHWDYTEYLHSFHRDPVNRLHTDMLLGKDFLRDFAIIGADAMLGFVLTFTVAWVLKISPEIALIGAGAGIYPDLLQFVYYKIRRDPWLRPVMEPLQRFHGFVQEGKSIYPKWYIGLGYQALLVVCVLIVLKIL